ncbi:DMT family transporter [Thalassospira profundimaris]|uniref:DMT family transporter n=1 Tax=Thalassospira profundimaris TaxID=502049 RepID=UPI000DED42FE|nr:DMT family transporter [Thalassospira profundimaris]
MKRQFQQLPNYVQAAIFATFAAVMAAGFSVTVRLATEDIPPLEVVFFRNLFGFLLILPVSLRAGFSSLHTTRWRMFFFRAILSMGAMTFWFSSLAYLPLAEATTLNFTVPLFGTVLAVLFLKEQIRHHRILALIAGFAGVAIIIRPGSDTMQLASILPIAAALCMASAGMVIKSLARTDSSPNIVLYTMLLMTPMTLIPALFVWQTPSWNTILILLGGTFMANITQLCNTSAFRLYDYSFVIGFNYLRLPFVVIIALVMFGEIPEIWLLPGAGLIIGSAIYIARREAVLAREAKRFDREHSSPATDLDPPPRQRPAADTRPAAATALQDDDQNTRK